MTGRHRRRTLILAALGIVAMLLLAAGISQLALEPGRKINWAWQIPTPQASGDVSVPGAEVFTAAMRVLLGLSFLLLPAGIIYVLINPKARKRIISNLMLALGLFLFFQIVGPRIAAIIRQNMGGLSGVLGSGDAEGPVLPTDFFSHPPQWLVWASSIIVAAVVIGIPLAVVMYVRWRRGKQFGPMGPLEEFAAETQQALNSLQAGADLRNTILGYYIRMTQVIRDRRGLEREQSMTPREFEQRLREAGLPQGPVQQLTYLFEQVRYGAKETGPAEQQLALSSLTAIIRACEAAA